MKRHLLRNYSLWCPKCCFGSESKSSRLSWPSNTVEGNENKSMLGKVHQHFGMPSSVMHVDDKKILLVCDSAHRSGFPFAALSPSHYIWLQCLQITKLQVIIHPQVGESLAISGLHQLHQGAADTSPNQKLQQIKLVSAYAPHTIRWPMQSRSNLP